MCGIHTASRKVIVMMKIACVDRAILADIAVLERAIFGDTAYPDFLFRQAFDLWPEWFLADTDDEGAVRGYVLGAPSNEQGLAWILSLAVDPSTRGKGIGNRLVSAVLDAMQVKGVERVRLTVHPENVARRLYERLGFTEVAKETGYFQPADPRLVMEHVLATGPGSG